MELVIGLVRPGRASMVLEALDRAEVQWLPLITSGHAAWEGTGLDRSSG
jgi:hypothetical protein